MKIAILGYGKMGRTIERLAKEQGHEVVLKISRSNKHELIPENLKKADVAIEFSLPNTAFDNVKICLESGVPVVSGTTAWLDQMEDAKAICLAKNGAFFYASNFSIGVNVLFAVNKYLASLMASQPAYDVSMEEIHHTQKLDFPSGTAITLSEGIMEKVSSKSGWEGQLLENGDEVKPFSKDKIGIVSKRKDAVPGTHLIKWKSEIDTLELSHVAHSREGFASGALVAAAWLVGKKGCFGMKDMLGF